MHQMAPQVNEFWLSLLALSFDQHSRASPALVVWCLWIRWQYNFSGNKYSRSSPALDNKIELNSFTDVAIDETTESKATKSKIKTEVEHSGSLSALADDVELDSFTDVAVDETTESKAKKSKIKTEL